MTAIFDQAANDYDAWYQTELGKTVDMVEKALVYELLKPKPGQKLLEIGCGTGNYTVELARQGLKVTGIDLSEAMLAKGQAKLDALGLAAELIHGDIHELELPTQSFDLILSVTALEFFPAPDKVLAKAYASLKPGGRMVMGVIAGNSPWSKLYKQIAQNDPSSVFNHANFYTKDELLSFLPRGEQTTLAGLYFPPHFSEFDREKALAIEQNPPNSIQPGFVCVCWGKTND